MMSVTASLVSDLGTSLEARIVGGRAIARGQLTVSQTPLPLRVASLLPDVLLAAQLVSFGDRTNDGQLVVGVATPWFEIIRQLQADPEFLYRVHWRRVEELVAGAFERDGWPVVVLTPASGDKGRDIIATRPGVGSVRIIGQVKAYAPGNVVTAEQVSAMLGTLELDGASKALVSTTSEFAPGVLRDERLKRHVPYRLELMDGCKLRDWLIEVSRTRP